MGARPIVAAGVDPRPWPAWSRLLDRSEAVATTSASSACAGTHTVLAGSAAPNRRTRPVIVTAVGRPSRRRDRGSSGHRGAGTLVRRATPAQAPRCRGDTGAGAAVQAAIQAQAPRRGGNSGAGAAVGLETPAHTPRFRRTSRCRDRGEDSGGRTARTLCCATLFGFAPPACTPSSPLTMSPPHGRTGPPDPETMVRGGNITWHTRSK